MVEMERSKPTLLEEGTEPVAKQEDETREYSFDGLAKGVADGTLSRSKALKALFAAILGGLLSIFALPSRDADAARRRLLKTL